MNVDASAPSGTEPSAARSHDGARGRKASFVVLGRVLLLLVAATAVVSGIVRARAHDRAASAALDRYVCPMHLEVVSTVPGDCPICGMALVPEPKTVEAMAEGGEVTARVERRFVSAQVRAAASLGEGGEGTAVLYYDDLVGLSAGEPATFFGGTSPNRGLKAHLLLDSPSPIDASTVRVRFRLDEPLEGPERAPVRLDIGSLQIAPRARELLVVPRSAVLYSVRGPYVLAASQPGEPFARRSIQVGRNLDSGYVAGVAGTEQGAVVVLAGLSEGERVIAGYTFFMDAERREREARAAGEGTAR